MLKRFFFLMLILTQSLAQALEFLYPIVNIDEHNILLMHQTQAGDTELFSFSQTTRIAHKELSSMYIPSDVQLLPSKQGFSFLDKGRIRIKFFNKRTPKTVDIYQPITDIRSVRWLSDTALYFSAKYRGHFKICMYDLEARELNFLTNLDDVIDYTCPQIIEGRLWCVAKDKLYGSKIIFAQIDPEKNDFGITNSTTMVTTPEYICHMSMPTKDECCVTTIQSYDSQKSLIKFSYYRYNFLTQATPEKASEYLFDFILPSNIALGDSQDRLYESIYPLLPRAIDDTIYYTSFEAESKKCALYAYNLISKQSKQILNPQAIGTSAQVLFSPVKTDQGKIFLGYNFDKQIDPLLGLDIDQTSGIAHSFLPCINEI